MGVAREGGVRVYVIEPLSNQWMVLEVLGVSRIYVAGPWPDEAIARDFAHVLNVAREHRQKDAR